MKKILIIEDDSIVAHIYRSRLEKEGYTVEVCEDGQTGFYRIHEVHPQAILLDLMLPKMNGIDILKKIRAERAIISDEDSIAELRQSLTRLTKKLLKING